MPNWIPLDRQGLQQDGLGQPQLQMKQPEVDYSIQDLPVFDPVYNPEYLRDFRGYDSDPLTVLDQTLAAPVRTGLKRLVESERDRKFHPLKTLGAGLKGAWEGLTTPIEQGVQGKDVAQEMGVSDRSMKQGKYAEMYPDMSLADLAGFGIEAGAEIPLGAGLFAGAGAKGFKKAGRKFSSLVDRKQRFEISDKGAKITDSGLSALNKGTPSKLGDILDHPELYKNYPQLKNVGIDVKNAPGSSEIGSYNPITGRVEINIGPMKNVDDIKETLLHEIQHNLQDIEGFAKGTNLAETSMELGINPKFKEGYDKWNELLVNEGYNIDDIATPRDISEMTERELDQYLLHQGQWLVDVKNKDITTIENLQDKYFQVPHTDDFAMDRYLKTAGEAEARDVHARMDFTEKQLMSMQPGSSHGYGLDELIVRDADGPMMSTTGKGLADDLAGKKNKGWYAHKLIIDKNAIDGLMKEGFKTGIGPNALPAYSGGKPRNIIEKKYAPHKGDVMVLIPEDQILHTPNGPKVKPGYKPKKENFIDVNEDYQNISGGPSQFK